MIFNYGGLHPPEPGVAKRRERSSPTLKLRRAKVELEGVEPSSKQAAKMLSTCLAVYWFSNIARKMAPKQYLSLLILSCNQGSYRTSPKLRAPRLPGWNQACPPAGCPVPTPCIGMKPQSTVIRLGSESVVIIANYVLKIVFNEPHRQCPACLQFHCPCCQIRSAPEWFNPARAGKVQGSKFKVSGFCPAGDLLNGCTAHG